jgi:hypothetical protein
MLMLSVLQGKGHGCRTAVPRGGLPCPMTSQQMAINPSLRQTKRASRSGPYGAETQTNPLLSRTGLVT